MTLDSGGGGAARVSDKGTFSIRGYGPALEEDYRKTGWRWIIYQFVQWMEGGFAVPCLSEDIPCSWNGRYC